VITMGTDEPVGAFAGILTLTCITPENISSRTGELRACSAVSKRIRSRESPAILALT
jgi:hypothetical protein